MNRKTRLAAVASALGALALTVAGCAHRPHLAWPWHAKAAPAPRAVEAVVVSSEDGVTVRAFSQYWVRNALLIDLSGAAGTGTIVLTQRPGGAWPVRLTFRVRPTEIKMLEVSGVQRLVLPTSTEGGETIDLPVAPGVYARDTGKITVHW